MQWLVNTSLLRVICRGPCLCKLTYPLVYRLTLNKSDLRRTSHILSTIMKHLPSISAIRTIIYEITWSPSSVLTLHRSAQLKLNSNVNWTIRLSQEQIRASAKQNGIRWCQQCDKPGAIGRTERDLLKGYELKTNYAKKTTMVNSCDLEQVTPTKYPNQKYV